MAALQCASGLAGSLPARRVPISRRSSRLNATERVKAVKTVEAPVAETGLTDVYIGKGRYIRDDPRKYPNKEDVGFLQGATGGWAGGEAALWELREELQKDSSKIVKKAPYKQVQPKPANLKSKPGTQVLYVGAGPKARFIVDDAAKYAGKESIGVFSGVTGGFAGGEKGVKQFVEEGELVLRPKQSPSTQYSAVSLGFVLALAGAGGSLLLNEVVDLGELAVKTEIVSAPIDDNTKYLILGAIALLGSAGLIAAGRAALARFSEDLRSSAQNTLLAGAFWIGVFLVARAVLEL